MIEITFNKDGRQNSRKISSSVSLLSQQRMDKIIQWLSFFVTIIFVILVSNLIRLQIIEEKEHLNKTNQNIVHTELSPTIRGRIFDKDGHILADNKLEYYLCIHPQKVNKEVLPDLLKLLKISIYHESISTDTNKENDIIQSISKLFSLETDSTDQVMCSNEPLTHDQTTAIKVRKERLPGIFLKTKTNRTYPQGDFLSHVLGYTCPIQEQQLSGDYKKSDFIGCSGIESAKEDILRGVKGKKVTLVDAAGRPIQDSTLINSSKIKPVSNPAIPGSDITLTIDPEIQRFVEAKLSTKRSASAVVLDPNTGNIIAMASYPNLPFSLRNGRISHAEYYNTTSNNTLPLYNKAVQLDTPPASTFKFIPALYALEHGIVPQKQICQGHFFANNTKQFRCTKTHGLIDLHGAIVQSCNVFFYYLGSTIGHKAMLDLAEIFGFGSKTGIELPETSGNLTAATELETSAEGAAMNTSIGHGGVRVTPLQLGLAYAAVTNGGILYQPSIIQSITTPDGVAHPHQPVITRKIHIKEASRLALIQAWKGVTQDKKGTAYGAEFTQKPTFQGRFLAHRLDLAGKTGTVKKVKNSKANTGNGQTVLNTLAHSTTQLFGVLNHYFGGTPFLPSLSKQYTFNINPIKNGTAWEEQDDAWFVGFAPSKQPKYIVVVLVNHGGNAGRSAAPPGQEIMQKLLEPKKNKQ